MSKIKYERVQWPDGTFGVRKTKGAWFARTKISYICEDGMGWVEPDEIYKYCRMTWEEATDIFSGTILEAEGFVKRAEVINPPNSDWRPGPGDDLPFGPPSRK